MIRNIFFTVVVIVMGGCATLLGPAPVAEAPVESAPVAVEPAAGEPEDRKSVV